MNRNLDGFYFRVERDGKWQSICWSDLTPEEMNNTIKDWSVESLKRLCVGLGATIKEIGDRFDIVCED